MLGATQQSHYVAGRPFAFVDAIYATPTDRTTYTFMFEAARRQIPRSHEAKIRLAGQCFGDVTLWEQQRYWAALRNAESALRLKWSTQGNSYTGPDDPRLADDLCIFQWMIGLNGIGYRRTPGESLQATRGVLAGVMDRATLHAIACHVKGKTPIGYTLDKSIYFKLRGNDWGSNNSFAHTVNTFQAKFPQDSVWEPYIYGAQAPRRDAFNSSPGVPGRFSFNSSSQGSATRFESPVYYDNECTAADMAAVQADYQRLLNAWNSLPENIRRPIYTANSADTFPALMTRAQQFIALAALATVAGSIGRGVQEDRAARARAAEAAAQTAELERLRQQVAANTKDPAESQRLLNVLATTSNALTPMINIPSAAPPPPPVYLPPPPAAAPKKSIAPWLLAGGAVLATLVMLKAS